MGIPNFAFLIGEGMTIKLNKKGVGFLNLLRSKFP
jgi:hypothetical protein